MGAPTSLRGQDCMKIRGMARTVAAIAVLACSTQISFANPGAIQRSGNVFFVGVCGGDSQTAASANCHADVVTDATGTPLESATPDIAAAPRGLGPADLQSAYNIPNSSSTATIAIVDAFGYPNAERDLGVYRAQYGLPPCTKANGCFKKVGQTGSPITPGYNIGWAQETALDLDMASAACPTCKILLVEANTNSFANLAAAVQYASSQPGVVAVSNSYGGSESSSSLSFASAYSHPGVAIVASSGDGGYGVESPADLPTVIAVGGTNLARAANSRGWTESAWTGAGSGCSGYVPRQSFQDDAFCTRRSVADVSAVADPASGVAVYGPSRGNLAAWLVFGGTSVSSPLIAGIFGNKGVGANDATGFWKGRAFLNDITTGANGSCGGLYFCTAGVGYDGPTGNGTPNGTGAFGTGGQ
jgi:subtilase family serine protease